MPKTLPIQSSFGAGELAPELILRRDTTQYRDGAKSLRNCRVLIAGGVDRRPGSWWRAELPGPAHLEEWTVNEGLKYVVALGAGRLDAYLDGRTAAGSLTGCPWTGDRWRSLGFTQQANTAFVCHPDMPVQVLTRTGASSWSRAAFSFYAAAGGRIHQPYYKVAGVDVTLQPSALTGAVTLTASAAVFEAGHVGCRVRYHKREIEVTAVTNATTAIGTVIEELPATLDLTVDSTQGFAVGQVVTGDTTGAKGVVSAVASGVVTVVLNGLLTAFVVDEKLVGPVSNTNITAVASAATPGAVTDWDEQLFSPVHGYPSCCVLHRNRLLFGGHRSAPALLIGSRIDNFYDFDVGEGGDAEGFIETLGDDASSAILQLHSAEQLLLLTDRGPYYVPESPANPFRASSLAFYPFGGSWPCARPRVDAFDGGAVMVSDSLIVKLRPTGNQLASWVADEVSLLSPHLIKAPVDAAFTSNYAGGPERYGVFVNADGTLAVMQLVEAQQIRNFVPWDTAGEYLSVAALGGALFAAVKRTLGGAETYLLEEFDTALTLDAATEYADLADATARYAGDEARVVTSTYHLGLLGDVADPPDGPYVVGLDYTLTIETLPPDIQDSRGNHAGRRKRITFADVHVISSARFAANGTELTAYQVTDDFSQPPPLKDGPQRFSFLGWAFNPTIRLTQADPLPLRVVGISMEVAY